MKQEEPGGERILRFLKFRGPQLTNTVARHLKITLPGARKHLQALEADGLVTFEDEAHGVGRPRRLWRLTEASASRFPDSHAFVTVEMIDAVRNAFGEKGLDRIIARRQAQIEARYAEALADCRSLASRLAKLAQLRNEEGYMAEWQKLADGTYLLCENHCPICVAARHCQGFCRSELALFRLALGPEAQVERTDHILAGARRCAYRITERKASKR